MKLNLKNKIKKALKKTRNKQDQDIALRQLLNFLGIDGKNEKALSEVTYFTCLKLLCESVGKVPLKIFKYESDGGVVTARGHPLYFTIHDRPNPYMTATTFWGTMENNRNHYGDAYAWIKGAGKKMSLWILPSDEVEIWYDDQKVLSDIPDIYYIYSHGGKLYKFTSEEIIHVKSSMSFDGIKGISIREQLKLTIDGNVKAQKMLNQMYKSGFTAKAVVQYTSDLSEENLKIFKNKIEEFAGSDLDDKEVRNIIPIPVGTTLTPLNVKLADSQFVEVKKYSAIQIASAFGIKPNQIGDYEKSSYASSESQQLSFYKDTLLYILKQYEEELNYKLLSREEIDNGHYFKFNIAVLLRADQKTQIETLSQAVSNFIYTPNEARAYLDKPAMAGGNRLLGNGASIPVELTGTQYTNNSEGKEEEKQWIEKTIEKILKKFLTKE